VGEGLRYGTGLIAPSQLDAVLDKSEKELAAEDALGGEEEEIEDEEDEEDGEDRDGEWRPSVLATVLPL
jgi:hypothetical protein